LRKEKIKYFETEDINADKNIEEFIDETTLGIGIGEVWSFSKEIIGRLGGRLIDFMGIPLPHYRGGAHYSWHILRREKKWACNLQIINEEMVPAKFDSGAIIKTKEYYFPETAKIPSDYFKWAAEQEVLFLIEFLKEIEQGKDFSLFLIDERSSIYFPRLYTKKQGYINWTWKVEDVESFICAFDDPYAGASTLLNGERKVMLKKCSVKYDDGNFHPFQAGLVFRKLYEYCCIAATDGTLVIREVFDEEGKNITAEINVGDRFYTPLKYLDEAMVFHAEYDSKGIKSC
jgi:methionyl-tRNA formyltransferase